MIQFITNCQTAKTLLEQKNIVAIPTETVYGLAADAFCEEAIKKIYQLKNRPIDKALALNVHPSWSIDSWCKEVPSYVKLLIKNFWPGPLTLVLPAKKDSILPLIKGPEDTIALRCPDHPLTLKLLKMFGRPIVAPSANPSDHFSAINASQVASYFPNCSLTILDGGPCSLGMESTILKVIDDNHCEILRYGAIPVKKIRDCIGFSPTPKINSSFAANTLKKPFYYFETSLQLQQVLSQHPNLNYALYTLPSSAKEAQLNLYEWLNEALDAPSKIIFIHIPQQRLGDWRAMIQQLQKFAKPIDLFACPSSGSIQKE